jgi:hypothetical protein
VPWAGGALFVPGVKWEQGPARDLVGNLIRWMLWADLKGSADLHKQIHNNIRSIGLARAAGYQPTWSDVDVKGWLKVWGGVVGKAELTAILEQQGAVARHQDVLDGLQ